MFKINPRIYGSLIIIAAIITALFIYGAYKSMRVVRLYFPLVDAAMEIRLEATTAHLWFEEYVSGDKTIDIQEVWRLIDSAQWYADAMLEGGESNEGTFMPLKDPAMRSKIMQVKKSLLEFEKISRQRYDAVTKAGIGTELDQHYDKIFNRFITDSDEVETLIQNEIAREKRLLLGTFVLIIVVLIALLAIAAVILVKNESQRTESIKALDKARQIAQTNERKLLITMESMGDGVITTDDKGIITYMNPVTARLTGWDSDEAKGQPSEKPFNIINEETRGPARNPVKQVIETRKIIGLANHTSLISKDGTERPIADSAAPIIDDRGNFTGVVLVFRDVSAQRQVEIEKELTSRQLLQSEKLASVGSMAAGIAHELNTPLNVMLGYMELMQVKLGPKSKFDEYLKITIEEIDFCRDLISTFMEYTRPSDDTFDKKLGLDINKSINDSIKLLALLKVPNTEVNIDLDKSIRQIRGNQKQMMQLFINLINNSIHAMPSGGKLWISSKLVKDNTGQRIEFEVKDSGEGITKENLKNVFDPFFTTKRPGKGTGLGLSICHRIIENHRGTIKITSDPGKGTVVRGSIPITD